MNNAMVDPQYSQTASGSEPSDLQAAVDFLLQHEQARQDREKRRAAKRRRDEREQRQLSDEQFRQAIHVIKWCVVGICSVMTTAFVLGVFALFQVEKAVVEVERDVEQVTARVDNILHEVEHPFEGAARSLGRDLDQSLGQFLGIGPSSNEGAE